MIPYRHSVSVACVVTDEIQRVLCIQRADNGIWQIPGGVLEKDEKIEDGLMREVYEETGLSIAPISLTGIYKHMGLGIVALVFRCKLVSGSPILNDEVSDIKWLTLEEVKRIMPKTFYLRVQDAFDLSSISIRSHDGVDFIDS